MEVKGVYRSFSKKELFRFLMNDAMQLIVIGIIIILYQFVQDSIAARIFVSVSAIVVFCFACRKCLLFPIDLIIGKKKAMLTFTAPLRFPRYESMIKKYYVIWSFKNNAQKAENKQKKVKRLRLAVPVCLAKEEIIQLQPPGLQKMEVEYYPFSKILVSYHIITPVNTETE